MTNTSHRPTEGEPMSTSTDEVAGNPVVARTPFYANRWEIREYADGTYDAAATTSPALSPGMDSFEQACGWVCDQERASAGEDESL